MAERLKPETFRLPIEKIRSGYKTDMYFNRTKKILTDDNHNPKVTMQVFQKVDGAVVCGTDHALSILHAGTGYYKNPDQASELFNQYLELEKSAYGMWMNLIDISWNDYRKVARQIFYTSQKLDQLWVNTFPELSIQSLYDGDEVASRETVMHIEGDIRDFVHLETLYLGALTDGTCVATNTRNIVEAANGKPIIMFGARHRSHESQAGDGYAAYIGGATSVSTNEQGEYWGSKGMGTIPHALIAAYGGDTVLATLKFDEHINTPQRHVNVVSLVDFDNDSVTTSVEVAKALGGNLWGVRLDTSENMIDKTIWERVQQKTRGAAQTTGVNPQLVFCVREELDRAGCADVKIIVSGGFDEQKIEKFETQGVPADVYGVGSALFKGADGKYDYTADVVKPVVKTGRQYNPNPRLVPLNMGKYLAHGK